MEQNLHLGLLGGNNINFSNGSPCLGKFSGGICCLLSSLCLGCCLFGYLFGCNYLQFTAVFFEILARNSTDSCKIYL